MTKTEFLLPLAMLAALGLAGCGESEPADTTDTAAVDDEAAIPAELTEWIETGMGIGGQQIAYSDGAGGTPLGMACLLDPARFRAVLANLSLSADAETMTLMAGETPLELNVVMDEAQGVMGDIALSDEVVGALRGATSLSATYDGQTVGPIPVPTAQVMQSFMTGCVVAMQAGNIPPVDGE